MSALLSVPIIFVIPGITGISIVNNRSICTSIVIALLVPVIPGMFYYCVRCEVYRV